MNIGDTLNVGDRIVVIEGPSSNLSGTVTEVDAEWNSYAVDLEDKSHPSNKGIEHRRFHITELRPL